MNLPISARMKPALTAIVFLMLAGPRLFAQGSVIFCNNNSTLVTNSVTGLPVSSANNLKAALYWSPIGSPNFVQIGATVNMGALLPGVYAAGTRLTGSATAGGATGQFQVRAWSGVYATYEQAVAAGPGILLGQSAVLQILTGNPTNVPPVPPSSLLAGGLQSFTVSPAVAPTSLDVGFRVFDGHSTVKIAMQTGNVTSPLRINKGGTNYGVQLVSTTDPKASRIRMQTASGVMAWKTYP